MRSRKLLIAVFALSTLVFSASVLAQEVWINGKWYPIKHTERYLVLYTTYHMSIEDVELMLDTLGIKDAVSEFLPAAHFNRVLLTLSSEANSADIVNKLRSYSSIRKVKQAPVIGEDSPLLPTGQILVRLRRGVEFNKVQKRLLVYHLEPVEQCLYLDRAYLMQLNTDELDSIDVAATLMRNEKFVEFAEPNFIKKIVPYFRPNDPFYNRQWHLHNTGEWVGTGYTNGTPGADVKAEQAWDLTRGNASVIIAIADDGMEPNHPDLGMKLVPGYDFLDNDNDPTPPCSSTQQGPYGHGISCAGVAAAKGNNGQGVSGLCIECSIMGIRLIGGYGVSDYTVGNAFRWICDQGAAVMNNSWGFGRYYPMSTYIKAGVDYCTTYGRNSLGTVVVFAAGNENRYLQTDEMESYERVFCVGASDQNDYRSDYSNYGPGLDVVAPSSGSPYSGWAIATTDYTGSCGYNQNGYYYEGGWRDLDSNGNYTMGFGGTSSAAPLVSGLFGLVFSANPGLTWQQAMDIVRNTADKVHPEAANYDGTGHSNYYGYGRANAFKAVQQALQGVGCGDITWEGKCNGSIAMWCENNRIITENCADRGEDCGQNDQGLYRCLPCQPTTPSCRDGVDNDCDRQIDEEDECGEGECYFPTFHAECHGTILTTCSPDNVAGEVDCASLNLICGYDERAHTNNCIQPPEHCEPTAPSCRDGKDNDCDNSIDEADECTGNECKPDQYQKHCEGNVLIYCNADNLVATIDCSDQGMICGDTDVGPACKPESCTPTEPSCTDNKDNDCDGRTDEADECPPAECDPATFVAYCDGNVLTYCLEGHIERVDCGASGKICSDENGIKCDNPPPGCEPSPRDCTDGKDNDCDDQVDEADECVDSCGGVTYQGICYGSVAYYCEGGIVRQVDCNQFDQICGQDANGNYRCINPPKYGSSEGCAGAAAGSAIMLLTGLLLFSATRKRR